MTLDEFETAVNPISGREDSIADPVTWTGYALGGFLAIAGLSIGGALWRAAGGWIDRTFGATLASVPILGHLVGASSTPATAPAAPAASTPKMYQ